MIENFETTRLVDAVIALTLIECALLLWHHHRSGRGVAPRDFLLNVLSGLCLMLALRCATADAGAAWVVLCLLGAGLAHGSDLWLRWRGDSRPNRPRRAVTRTEGVS